MRGAMPGLTTKDDARDIAADSSAPSSQNSDNVFAVLAQRASERSSTELWTTAVVGATNAVFVFSRHSQLHWLGAGFVAVAAYGIWGLTNREIVMRSTRLGRAKLDLLRGVRGLMVPTGIIAAVAAVGSFMAVALGGWIH